MKLRSKYLNPFQSFPERERHETAAGTVSCTILEHERNEENEERPRAAIENNMSRAVFSALAHAENPNAALASFVGQLAENAQSDSDTLCQNLRDLAAALRRTDPSKIEIDLSSWPNAAVAERSGQNVYLIGISLVGDWTHNKRDATPNPKTDAWIYVRGEMLLVFEFKIDDPLDATQVSGYIHALELPGRDRIPCAEPCSNLSEEQAQAVQVACSDLVLDADWSAVTDALKHIQEDEGIGDRGRWLAGQAVAYLKPHIPTPPEPKKAIRAKESEVGYDTHVPTVKELQAILPDDQAKAFGPKKIRDACQTSNRSLVDTLQRYAADPKTGIKCYMVRREYRYYKVALS